MPGASCQLVVMDKIPFPRPDDPLMSARQKAVEDAGGNGFMAVAATHAALLMAQGAGRLVRASGDRGVVAVLDQRLATARYGSYLQGVAARLLVHHGPEPGAPFPGRDRREGEDRAEAARDAAEPRRTAR